MVLSLPAPSPKARSTGSTRPMRSRSTACFQVFTHENAPRLPRSDSSDRDEIAPPGSPFRPLLRRRDQVQCPTRRAGRRQRLRAGALRGIAGPSRVRSRRACNGSREAARGSLQSRNPGRSSRRCRSRAVMPRRPSPTPPFRSKRSTSCRVEHHNPMEPFATTVVRDEDGKFTSTTRHRGCRTSGTISATCFGFSKDDLRVVLPFVGGAFAGLRPQYQVFLAVLAARELKRSVRVTLTRQQMFSLGHRPTTWQRVALGAAPTARSEPSSTTPYPRPHGSRTTPTPSSTVGPALPVRQRQT